MRKYQTLLLTLLLVGGIFEGTGCTLARPLVNATGEAVEDWWKQKGKEQVGNIAHEAAKTAADGALTAARDWTDKKVDDNNKRLEAVGINPTEITGIKSAASKALEYAEDQKSKDQPIDWTTILSIFGAGLAAYTTGSVGKGAYRKVTGKKDG